MGGKEKHFVQNTYIYSKLLTENLCKIYCREQSIALTIIRPSQIIVSSDNRYRGGHTGPLANVLRAFCNPLIRVLVSNSRVNVIPVDYVAQVIHSNLGTEDEEYRVVYATCNDTVTPIQLMRYINPRKRILVFGRDTFLCRMIRMLELCMYRMLVMIRILTYRRYRLIRIFYRDYIYFQTNTWKFETKMRVKESSVLRTLKVCAISNNWIV